jgi:hypothetical protein
MSQKWSSGGLCALFFVIWKVYLQVIFTQGVASISHRTQSSTQVLIDSAHPHSSSFWQDPWRPLVYFSWPMVTSLSCWIIWVLVSLKEFYLLHIILMSEGDLIMKATPAIPFLDSLLHHGGMWLMGVLDSYRTSCIWFQRDMFMWPSHTSHTCLTHSHTYICWQSLNITQFFVL